ncbi:class I SAM-dependent methyltransferase [Aspergillus lucknowensis]|uniref:S-adenosyl-L-methionine-dependent methyltransferase n=1 Tax=Aspergillus lucknowensis TaxID=176173 RepID=A0ABR4LJN7_9EURO
MPGNNNPTTLEWLFSLLEPGQILREAMSYYIAANIKAILRGQVLAPLLRAHELRDEAFGKFWIAFSCTPPLPTPQPLALSGSGGKSMFSNAQANHTHLANREAQNAEAAATPAPPAPAPPETNSTGTGTAEVQSSSDAIPSLLAHASGVVLDVGPGTGTQMPLLTSPAIKAIYGAEPCRGLHGELRRRAVAEGVADRYTILPCSVVAGELGPELGKHGLPAVSVFDTIITIRVLCSVPEVERTAAELYALLRPGGKLIIVEHVVNPWMTAKGSVVARFMQGVYHVLGWRWVMGDCCLNRDTERVLRGVAEGDGGWERFEVDRLFESSCMPYIAGVAVKKGSPSSSSSSS